MNLVVDASAALKWFLAYRPNERFTEEAAAVGDAIETRGAALFAPPHWVLEVIAVLARDEPALVGSALIALAEFNPTIVATPDVLKRAADLSIALDHHLFDTLYHAVALEVGATLVTADERYYGKAHGLGAIVRLAEFGAPELRGPST